MAGKSDYSDCELNFIEQGYDEGFAKELCESSEGRSSDEVSEKSRSDEKDEKYDYWGEI